MIRVELTFKTKDNKRRNFVMDFKSNMVYLSYLNKLKNDGCFIFKKRIISGNLVGKFSSVTTLTQY